jgi:hypothetical protein
MQNTNLAQRLDEFEATLESLRLTDTRIERQDVANAADFQQVSVMPVRRASRIRSIQIRDQGLRSFRVC